MYIDKFKSLLSNADPNDIKLEYLQEANNVRLTNRFTETKFYQFEHIPIAPSIQEILAFDIVYLDNDKLQSQIVNDIITPTYKYNLKRRELLIANDHEATKFFLDGDEIKSFYTGKSTKATIYQDNGNVLILLDNDTLWLGFFDRYVWINGVRTHHYGYYIDRYLEPFIKNGLGVKNINGSIWTNNNRRLGLDIAVEILSEGSVPLEETNCNFTFVERHQDTNQLKEISPDKIQYNNIGIMLVIVDIFRCRDDKGKIIYSNDPLLPEYFVFPESDNYSNYYLVPSQFFYSPEGISQNFKLKDGRLPDAIWNRVNTVPASYYWRQTYNTETILSNPGGFFAIPKSDFENIEFIYIGQSTVSDIGIDSSYRNYEIIATSILDDKEEIVTEYIKGNVEAAGSKYGIKLKTTIPVNVNKRLTGIGYYIRFYKETDFKQIKVLNLISSDKVDNSEFSFGAETLNGIEAVQAIGTLFDYDTYNIINVFDYFQRINGLGFIVSNNQLYGPIAGSGKVMDLFYNSNRIPNITNKKILFLSNVNNIPAVHDNEKTTLLLVSDSGLGTFSYSKRDIFGFIIKDKFDIAESPDGVALHTKEGVYVINGSNMLSVSKEIDDMIELNHETGKIFFNTVEKELYYIQNNILDHFYRYSFTDRAWTTHSFDMIPSLEDFRNIAIDENGSIYFVMKERIFHLSKFNSGIAKIVTHFSDLGRALELKSFAGFRFDFQGSLMFNGKTYKSDTRTQKLIKIPQHLRIPKEKISIEFEMYDESRFYSLDIHEETVAIADDFTELDKAVIPVAPTPIIKEYLPFVESPQETLELFIPLIGNVTANTAEIVWATSVPADSKVIYGISPSELISQEYNNEEVKYHSLIMTNLQLEALYYAQIISKNIKGETVTSDVIAFFTGKEITVQVLLDSPQALFSKRVRKYVQWQNTLSEEELLITEDADAEYPISISGDMIVRDKITFTKTNIIGSNYETSVS